MWNHKFVVMNYCKRSTPGYTYIRNNSAQTWETNGLLQVGNILAMSSANNILISGNSLVVTNKGTYKLDITVIGTPATVSSTVIPTINVNGVAIASASITGGATAVMDSYNVSTITSLNRGDIVTITNTGASALDISAVTNPGYNVNIMIERFN